MREMVSWSRTIAALSLSFTFGCHGSSGSKDLSGQGAAPSAATPAEFCDTLARLGCQGRMDCCSDAGPCTVEDDVMDCRADIEAMVASGRASYDRKAAERMLGHWTRWVERCEIRFTELGSSWWWLAGHVPEGGDCRDAEGAFRDDICVPGTRCAAARCVKPAALGDACSFDKPCILSLTCPRGICVPLKTLGEPCELANECDSSACVQGRCQDDGFLIDHAFCR
jgi:hypothetical protein